MITEPDVCAAAAGRFTQRGRAAAGWMTPVLSGAALVLMPKCPACFAAYVAMGTGIGLSVPAASWLRVLLLVLCIGSMAFLAARFVHRRIARRAVSHDSHDPDSNSSCAGRCASSSCFSSPHPDTPSQGRREQES